jgi:fused signal recognition particle receptor
LGTGELNGILREEIAALMKDPVPVDPAIKPYVIMVVGVNGVGKTTTIGKARPCIQERRARAWCSVRRIPSVQLRWINCGSGANAWVCPLVQQGMNADPAAVAFDTVQHAKAQGVEIVIIDTAGRLHNKVGLMNELTKVRNVMRKVIPDAPHEVLLVLDASTGQNAIEQARQFTKATDVTALALTKIDGTAKGGVAIGISEQFGIPIKYLGVGKALSTCRSSTRKRSWRRFSRAKKSFGPFDRSNPLEGKRTMCRTWPASTSLPISELPRPPLC